MAFEIKQSVNAIKSLERAQIVCYIIFAAVQLVLSSTDTFQDLHKCFQMPLFMFEMSIIAFFILSSMLCVLKYNAFVKGLYQNLQLGRDGVLNQGENSEELGIMMNMIKKFTKYYFTQVLVKMAISIVYLIFNAENDKLNNQAKAVDCDTKPSVLALGPACAMFLIFRQLELVLACNLLLWIKQVKSEYIKD